ncbi:hypothetical protein IMCC3317_09090 [Kordia antarctica]|uniref:Uncharacterized protein n=1 Tax=Kordia antarctica TaxID=1218801 RepID=A0A7L4ZFV3_9FLAO|nr:hypothetical protein [Kordia antarctica]QHI35563.1 hypothetical protein IMCC3317_09090 [Kordia antarctica]
MTIHKKENKFLKLLLSIIFDLVGCISYILPGFAEATDIIWAPVSAWIMTKMYKGTSGKVGAVISFIEEAIPFTDIIPTFTLMWLYTYVINPNKKEDKNVIDITDMQ